MRPVAGSGSGARSRGGGAASASASSRPLSSCSHGDRARTPASEDARVLACAFAEWVLCRHRPAPLQQLQVGRPLQDACTRQTGCDDQLLNLRSHSTDLLLRRRRRRASRRWLAPVQQLQSGWPLQAGCARQDTTLRRSSALRACAVRLSRKTGGSKYGKGSRTCQVATDISVAWCS